jgi:hypothetical protein
VIHVTFKLFGRVAALVMLAWAAGNSGQIGSAQPATETSGRLVWFVPNMGGVTSDGRAFLPPEDARKLFEPGAPWPTAEAAIQVFEFYVGNVAGIYDLPIAQAVQALKEANIAIAVEVGGQREWWSCKGERMAQVELEQLAPIRRAGGQIRYLALDSFFGQTLASGPSPCRYTTVEQAAAQLLIYIKAIRKEYPDVKIGLIEPVPWYSVGSFPTQPGGENLGDLPQVLDKALAVLKQGGETIDFFHADSPYDVTERLPGVQGWAKLKALQDFVRSRGMRFGLIYNSDRAGQTSDELFFRETLLAKAKFAQAGGDPDDIILQSWYWYPRQWLPEDQPYSYTYLVREFLKRQVPRLSLSVSTPASDGSRQVSGTLNDQVGNPISNAPIELSLTAQSGPGQYAEYTVSGTVPAGATKADVGFRVNDECGCSGTSEFFLYGVRYLQGNETTNRVPNGNFSQGLEGWGPWGTGTAQLEPSDRGLSGTMLHVKATPTQTADINSTDFRVTVGATYTVTFAARVAPVSVGSGYFSIVFLSSSREVERQKIFLEPARISVGKATSASNGAFQFTLRNLPEGKLLLEASYPGDDARYFPARAGVTLEPGK